MITENELRSYVGVDENTEIEIINHPITDEIRNIRNATPEEVASWSEPFDDLVIQEFQKSLEEFFKSVYDRCPSLLKDIEALGYSELYENDFINFMNIIDQYKILDKYEDEINKAIDIQRYENRCLELKFWRENK